MTLRTRLSVPILVISVLLVGFLYGYWMPAHLAETEAEVRSSAERHLASVAESCVPLLLARQLDALYENLDALRRRNADWVTIELTTPDGNVLYPLTASPGELVPDGDERVVRRPIAVVGKPIGMLAVKIDVSRRLGEIRRRHGQLVVASLVVLLAYVGLLWMVLERWVRRPLHVLAHASKKLAAGEFDTPLERAGSEEVASLVESFSGMRESIRGYQAELIAKNDSLTTLSLAVTQSPISIAISGRDRRVEYANPRFLELMGGADGAEVVGRPCVLLEGHGVPDERRAELLAAVGSGKAWRGEISHRRPSGEPFHAVAFVAPVRDDAGEVAHWLAVLEDVTQQRALEQQLAQAQKMEALGTLAGGIAHDFNNILAPILAFTELARGQAAGNGALTEDLDRVSEAALRARDLVRQILTFSRKAELRKVPVEVAAVAREALKLLRASLPATIEIRQRLEGVSLVLADPTQIHQVIMNLCTNAFHAMESTGGVLAVSVTEVEAGPEPAEGGRSRREVAVAVSDTGVGMDRATLQRVFDPYFTTKEKGKGTGLGLSVVDGIVRGHGGRIAVYSEPGVGTTFRVHLPIAAGAEEAPSRPVARPAPTTRHERVLLVEDEEPIRKAACRYLSELGYRVEPFGEGRPALEAFRGDPSAWDLLVTDMTMPGMSGLELARRILELRPGMPIVLCSGYSSLLTAQGAARVGVRECVEKPVIMGELVRAMQRALAEPAAVPAPPAPVA